MDILVSDILFWSAYGLVCSFYFYYDWVKYHGFYEGELPVYKHKIGFNNHGIPRSIEIYAVENPIGFLKKWEGK